MNMKRILSLIMVLCMVMTMIVPGTALADTEEVVRVTAPQPETAYKLGLDRNGTVYYFTGSTDGVSYRLASSTDLSQAVNVYLEFQADGYRLYFMSGSYKTYIRVSEYQDGNAGYGKGTLQLTTSRPEETYAFDTEAYTLVHQNDSDNSYYIGTYNSYTNFSVSNTFYISGNNAANVDVSQYPARLYEVKASEESEPTETTLPGGEGWTVDGDTLTISGTGRMDDYYSKDAPWYSYADTVTKVVIENGVTSIGNYAFGGFENLTSVTIPNSVTKIGSSAFDDCFKLTTVTIPNSVTTIGDYAFSNCTALKMIDIPDTLTSLGSSAFYGCSSLTEFVIPSGIARTPDYLFYECTALTSITIPTSVTFIDYGLCRYCSALERVVYEGTEEQWQKINILTDDNYEILGSHIIYHGSGCDWIEATCVAPKTCSVCSKTEGTTNNNHDWIAATCKDPKTCNRCGMTEGTADADHVWSTATCTTPKTCEVCGTTEGEVLPHNNQYWDNGNGTHSAYCRSCGNTTVTDEPHAFMNTTCICGAVYVPEEYTEGPYAYNVINGNAVIIGFDHSVQGGLTIPDTLGGYPVTEIADHAFYSARSLFTLQIPDSVVTIGNYAFYDSINLDTVIIGDGVKTIGEEAFGSCTYLRQVQLGNSVETIGEYAFSGCEFLYCINLPDSLTSLGRGAFYYCPWLSEVVIPEGVTTIENATFYECQRLESVQLPSSLTTIGDEAFYNCFYLKDITIPENVTSIGNWAFQSCFSLETVDIPAGLTSIGTDAFKYCSSLKAFRVAENNLVYSGDDTGVLYDRFKTKIILMPPAKTGSYTVPLSVTNIESSAFYGCSLSTVNIPSTVGIIGSYAFANSQALTSVTIGSNPTRSVRSTEATVVIGSGAFQSCENLTTVVMGSNVEAIESYAFQRCVNLQEIVLPENLRYIGEFAFDGCTALTSVVLPGSLTEIADYAFSDCDGLEEVIFCGSEEQWSQVTIGSENSALTDAALSYHSVPQWNIDKEPASCTDVGIRSGYCTVCGEYVTQEYVPGHSFGEFVTVTPPTCSDSGESVRTCSKCGETESRIEEPLGKGMITVDPSLYPESEHNYAPDTDETKTFTYPGASALTLTFSENSEMEDGWDYIYILDKNDQTVNTLTGYLGGRTITVEGDTVKIRLDSDGSISKWGYSFQSIEAAVSSGEHSFENGVCTVCGVKDPDAKLEIVGVSTTNGLALDGVIYVNAVVAFKNGDKTANTPDLTRAQIIRDAKILFWSENNMPANWEDAVIGTEKYSNSVKAAGSYGGFNEYSAYSYGIPAKEYNDTVYYRTYIVVDGVEYYGEVAQYSVATYAYNQLKKDTANAKKMHQLLGTMLNYGAAAQLNFKYKTDKLVNADLQTYIDAGKVKNVAWEDSMLTDATAASAEMTVNFTQNQAKRSARTLLISGAVEAKMTFQYKPGSGKGTKLPDGSSVTFYYWTGTHYEELAEAGTPLTKKNASYTVTQVTEDYSSGYGYEYSAISQGIAAKRLGETLYIACVFTVDGIDYCSGVEAYSPEVYAKAQLPKTTVAAVTKELLKAMVIYGEAAKAYFGN